MRNLVPVASLVLAALCVRCVPDTSRVVRRPDGHSYYAVECTRITGCYGQAQRKCPGGYTEPEGETHRNSLLFQCNQ